jgi:hypothetical protein
MPIKPIQLTRPTLLAAVAVVATHVRPALAQTDDAAPFYVGGSAGVSHVSNIYRQADSNNSDTVVSLGVLGGLDERLGRQHLKLDGSLQDNRYSSNKQLNNQSYSLRTALEWQTVGHLSGTLSAKSDRSLADYNIGNGAQPIFTKNTERNDEYLALARLGVGTRYSLEGGWTRLKRNFSAPEYDRFVYSQNTGSLGFYAFPGASTKVGVAARHTKGKNPRYPIGLIENPTTHEVFIVTDVNDYTRNDVDLTLRWETGGSSALNTRISRSRTKNSLQDLRGFSATTGAIGWDWQTTAKLRMTVQYSRDTGQESFVRGADVNRIYKTWKLGADYAVTGKVSLNASARGNRANRSNDTGVAVYDALEDNKFYSLGLRWAYSRSLSLGCQYDHASRNSSVPQYVYSAGSYGCTGQILVY